MGKFIDNVAERILIIAFFVLLSLLASYSFLGRIYNLGIQDWDQHLAYAQASRITIVKYHQFPLWNPYHCGGTSLIGNPQTDFLSPYFLIILFFGPAVGYKILFFINIFIGLVGFYLLGKQFKLSNLGSVFLSSSYMLSGLLIIPFAVGMTQFLSVAFFPYLWLFFSRAIKKNSVANAVACSLTLLCLFFFGFHYFPQVILFLAVLSLIYVWQQKNFMPLIYFGAATCMFLSLSAVKLLPAIETVSQFPRIVKEDISGYSIRSLLYSLLSVNQTFEGFSSWGKQIRSLIEGVSYGIDENGMYVGSMTIVLSMIGVFKIKKQRQILLPIFIFFLWLSLGYNIQPSLYAFFQQLPIFNYLRVAQRYRYFFMIPAVIFAGYGFDFFRSQLDKIIKNGLIVRLLLLLLLVVHINKLLLVNQFILSRAFEIPSVKAKKIDSFIQTCSNSLYDKQGNVTEPYVYSSWSAEYPNLLSNYGTAQGCYEPIPVQINARCSGDDEYQGEFYLMNGNGWVKMVNWSPNRMEFLASLTNTDRLIINQNYNNGWQVLTNGEKGRVESIGGLIGTKLNQSTTKIVFFYLPKTFVIGAGISLLSLSLMVFYILSQSLKKNL